MADGDTLCDRRPLHELDRVGQGEDPVPRRHLPGIGKLFTRTKDQKVKTELVFFITPHILRKNSDYKIITPPGEAERLREAGEPCAAPDRSSFGLPVPSLR